MVHERLSDGFLGVSQVKQICPGGIPSDFSCGQGAARSLSQASPRELRQAFNYRAFLNLLLIEQYTAHLRCRGCFSHEIKPDPRYSLEFGVKATPAAGVRQFFLAFNLKLTGAFVIIDIDLTGDMMQRCEPH